MINTIEKLKEIQQIFNTKNYQLSPLDNEQELIKEIIKYAEKEKDSITEEQIGNLYNFSHQLTNENSVLIIKNFNNINEIGKKVKKILNNHHLHLFDAMTTYWFEGSKEKEIKSGKKRKITILNEEIEDKKLIFPPIVSAILNWTKKYKDFI